MTPTPYILRRRTRAEARAHLAARYDTMAADYPSVVARVTRDRYIAVNTRAAMRYYVPRVSR